MGQLVAQSLEFEEGIVEDGQSVDEDREGSSDLNVIDWSPRLVVTVSMGGRDSDGPTDLGTHDSPERAAVRTRVGVYPDCEGRATFARATSTSTSLCWCRGGDKPIFFVADLLAGCAIPATLHEEIHIRARGAHRASVDKRRVPGREGGFA